MASSPQVPAWIVYEVQDYLAAGSHLTIPCNSIHAFGYRTPRNPPLARKPAWPILTLLAGRSWEMRLTSCQVAPMPSWLIPLFDWCDLDLHCFFLVASQALLVFLLLSAKATHVCRVALPLVYITTSSCEHCLKGTVLGWASVSSLFFPQTPT